MSSRGEPAPRRHRIEIEGGPTFEVDGNEDTLLRGALRAGQAFTYECSVGGCGSCRFELLEGEVQTLWEQAPGLSERDRRRGKRLACQSRPLSDCRIRTRLEAPAPESIAPRRMTGVLESRRAITADMAEFTFHLPDAPTFLPGQYALLYLPQTHGARAYSMSGVSNGDEGSWRFIVRRVPGGTGTGALFDRVDIGDPVPIDGPFGHGYLRPTERNAVCVAGGSGLGPMLSVARGALRESSARSVHFFLGLRTQDDLSAARELEPLRGPRLLAATVLSAPSSEPAWTGATGFVHAAVEAALPQPLAQFDFYFAGPPAMVEAMQELLVIRHRVPHAQIHFDRFV